MRMNMNIQGTHRILRKLNNMYDALDSAAKRGVNRGGAEIQSNCRVLCPVDSGALRNSIIENTIGSDACYESRIGTNKDYVIYVEKGTGVRAGRMQTVGVRQECDDDFYTIHGQPPRPFMEPGFEISIDKAVEVLTNEVKGALNV